MDADIMDSSQDCDSSEEKEYWDLDRKRAVGSTGVNQEITEVEENNLIEGIEVTTVYTANDDESTADCLKNLLNKEFLNDQSVSVSEENHDSSDDTYVNEDKVFVSSDDEKSNASDSSEENNSDDSCHDEQNQVNLSTSGKKRTASFIEHSSRKRLCRPEKWIRNIRKQAASSGQEYISGTTKKIVQARSVQESCGPGCRFKCCQKVTEEARNNFFADFWSVADHGKKYDFILRHVHETKNKETLNDESKRNYSRVYTISYRNESIKVCQSMFLKTLNISKGMVNTAFKKLKNGSSDLVDKRGKSKRRPRTNEAKTQSAIEHINMFPHMESHYVRSDSQREYLEEGLNISRMYLLYVEWAKENEKEIASKHHYTDVFNTKFNLGFFRPKKDQCDLCEGYKNAKDEKKQELEEKYAKHIKNKKTARDKKEKDKELAKTSLNSCLACFDFQKVLNTPKTEASCLYYKRKLSIYNFTVYDITSHEGICYVWNENDAKRGANEVASCLLDFINKKVSKGITKFYFWSDNCTGQNRNRNNFAMMAYASTKYNVDIKYSFLEVGHTQNEGDSVHATIERYCRGRRIFSQNEWSDAIRKAKQSSPKYEVQTVTFDKIYDFKDLMLQLNWEKTICTKKSKKTVAIGVSKIKEILFSAEKPNIMEYKSDFDEKYETLVLRKGRQQVNLKKYSLINAYHDVQGIPSAKRKDLLTLCKSNIIPPDYHAYYESFPVRKNIDQDDNEEES